MAARMKRLSFFFSSRRRHTRLQGDWSSDVCSSDLSVIPEFFGDTMLCNGTVYPSVKLEQRRYRFRILNACNARFLNINLYVRDASVEIGRASCRERV